RQPAAEPNAPRPISGPVIPQQRYTSVIQRVRYRDLSGRCGVLITYERAAAISFAASPAAAEANGCIKGAIVGGIAGHDIGLGALGSAAGCLVVAMRLTSAQPRL